MCWRRFHHLLLAFNLGLASCTGEPPGEEDGGDDGGQDAGRDAGGDVGRDGDGSSSGPTCDVKEFIAEGTLNGLPAEALATVAGFQLENTPGDTGCHLNLYFQGGGRLRLEWDDTMASGETGPASGSVNLEAQGGINVGNCSNPGHASEMTLFDDGVTFLLRDLRKAPYCSGDSVAGELRGCASFE